MKNRKTMTKAILIAGSSMLIALYTVGCKDIPDNQQRQPLNEFFPEKGAVRDSERAVHAQAASAARADGTLQPYHFDKGDLNSLGRNKLALMVEDDDSNNPLVLYLNLPVDDEFKASRQDAIVAYLKDEGLEEKQISFKLGINPGTLHPAAEGLKNLAKTDTGKADGDAKPAGGDAGGGGADAGSGMSGK